MVVNVPLRIGNQISCGPWFHEYAPPPPPPPVPCFEMIALEFWAYGYATGQNKLTQTVLHMNNWIVQDGHDCGTMIPDLTAPTSNALSAIFWVFSSRKPIFSASTVELQGTPPGLSGPNLPVMTCGKPVEAPMALGLGISTATAGVSLADILRGVADIAMAMAFDYLFKRLGGEKLGEKIGENLGEKIAGKLGKKLTEAGAPRTIISDCVVTYAEKAVGLELGKGTRALAKSVGKKSLATMTKSGTEAGLGHLTQDNPTFSVDVGHPTTAKYKVEWDAKEGLRASSEGLLPSAAQRFESLF